MILANFPFQGCESNAYVLFSLVFSWERRITEIAMFEIKNTLLRLATTRAEHKMSLCCTATKVFQILKYGTITVRYYCLLEPRTVSKLISALSFWNVWPESIAQALMYFSSYVLKRFEAECAFNRKLNINKFTFYLLT